MLAGGVSLLMIRPELPTASSVWRLCTQFATRLDPLAMAVLVALGLAGTVIAFGLQSTGRQLRADRRLRSRLTLVDTVQIDGGPVTVAADERPEAFCMGYLRPRIYVSTGALDGLSEDELAAVLAHERHHLVRRDPLRLLVGRAAAEALFFLPPLRRLLGRYLALAELAADEAAIKCTGTEPLASALLHFGEHRTPAAVVGIAAERVDHLGGQPARWRFSGPWLARWLSISVATFALVFAGSLVVQGRSLSSTAVIAQACLVGMTGVPILAGVMLTLGGRRRARLRHTRRLRMAAGSPRTATAVINHRPRTMRSTATRFLSEDPTEATGPNAGGPMNSDVEYGTLAEIRLEQGVVRYRTMGEGTPVVFVHGLMTNSVVWHRVMPLIATDARCIAPDWPLGSHSVPLEHDADLTPPGLAKLVTDFLAALDLHDVTLVGITVGGAYCQMIAAENPDRVRRIVLLPSDAYDNLPPMLLRYLRWSSRVPGLLYLLAQSMRFRPSLRMPFAYGWAAKRPFERAALDAFLEPIRSMRGTRRDLAKVLRRLTPDHTQAAARRFGEFDKPVLIIWSHEDRLLPFTHAERLVKAFPQSRLETVPDSYSYVVQDQPERTAELIRDFVKSS